jgi:Alternative complex III, ActD subunit
MLGIFDDPSKAVAAATALRADRLGDVTVYSPTVDHQIDAALGPGKSPVRLFTLVGGILGCATGFGFPIYTVLAWPIITGGKPIISLPTFAVIAFELTILFAALSTALGFLIFGGLPDLRRTRTLYDPRFSDDRWGVLVVSAKERGDAARARLVNAGAEEVRHADA